MNKRQKRLTRHLEKALRTAIEGNAKEKAPPDPKAEGRVPDSFCRSEAEKEHMEALWELERNWQMEESLLEIGRKWHALPLARQETVGRFLQFEAELEKGEKEDGKCDSLADAEGYAGGKAGGNAGSEEKA